MICFFFNDTATTEIYTLSLHDALPISAAGRVEVPAPGWPAAGAAVRRRLPDRPRGPSPLLGPRRRGDRHPARGDRADLRSEEHTSELQSRQYLVCRLLLEKKTYS